MNFSFMPELNWCYGYFVVLAMMGGIAPLMFWYLMKKSWLDNSKQKRKRVQESKVL
ncbi:hypothetical protein D1953_05325 [Peribacillus asahii]|uniref:Uncharacterized protein n=1 Tax=Peribacillus asahii TaxID=228899 RepID=A0A398BCR2_9BACI|nr:hypothetical protein D1953_05325 [Peribacillus asahii]